MSNYNIIECKDGKDLFEEWKNRPHHKNELFITDGIIDTEKWEKSKLKILFLLKEAYESEEEVEEGWDLCKYIPDFFNRPRYKMWWTLAQWAYGINSLLKGEVAVFPEDFKNDPQVKEALLSSAVVNVKKSAGKKNSDFNEIKKYAENDWDLLEKQIKMISPKLVVCGYTWPAIEDLISHKKLFEWTYESMGNIFIDFWHPANHYPNKLNYYSLCTVINLSGILK